MLILLESEGSLVGVVVLEALVNLFVTEWMFRREHYCAVTFLVST